MATIIRDIERPAFLDRPAAGQLSFGGAGASVREAPSEHGENAGRGAGRTPLSERLRIEQTAGTTTGAAAYARTGTARGGEATLDELLVGAWEGLSVRRSVACPVCAAPMHPHAASAGGGCGECGTQLR